MAENVVSLNVSVETQKAIQSLGKFGNEAAKTFKMVASAAVAVGTAIAGALALKETIDAARRQEDAITSVATAMARTGEFSREAVADMEAFASELQNITGVGDEASLEMIALAKSMGATNDQAKLMTKAAIEMSAATGKSAEESIKVLSKTLGGAAGELAELNPAIRALTEEQLKAGAAAEIMLAQYGGTAAAKLNTFSGALEATKGRFGDLLEEIGNLIIKNPVVIDAIKAVGKVFQRLGSFLADNRQAIIDLVNKAFLVLLDVVEFVGKALSGLIPLLRVLTNAFLTVASGVESLLSAFYGLEPVRFIIKLIHDGISEIGIAVADLFSFLLNLSGAETVFSAIGVDIETVKETLDGFKISAREAIDEFQGDELSKAYENAALAIDSAKESTDKFFRSAEVGAAGATNSVGTFRKELEKSASTGAPDILSQIEKQFKDNPPTLQVKAEIVGPIISEQELKVRAEQEAADKKAREEQGKLIADVISGFVGALKQGADGAASALAQGATLAATAAFGPAGAAAGPLVELLAQSPEALKAQIKAFVDAIPGLITNIITNIGTLVTELAVGLAENADKIIIALADPVLMAKVATALTKALVITVPTVLAQQLGTALQKALTEDLPKAFAAIFDPIMWNELLESLGSGIREFFIQFGHNFQAAFDKVAEQFKEIFSPITDAFDRLINFINDLKGGSAKEGVKKAGGKIAKGFKDVFGLATGGFVTGSGTSDTVPAVLTPGELVIDRTTGPKLQAFLDKQQSSDEQLGYMTSLLSQLVSLMSQPMTISTKTEVNQKAFADIVLTLNRNNARLA